MNYDDRKIILSDLQRLTDEQSKTIHDLIKLGWIDSKQLEKLINGMVKDRFTKGKAYIEFASKLDINSPEDQPHIISRNYYGMYHIARAVVFHTSRRDIDEHKALPKILSDIISSLGEKLARWRIERDTMDYSPYLPHGIDSICIESIHDAKEVLVLCEQYLKERGVDIENC